MVQRTPLRTAESRGQDSGGSARVILPEWSAYYLFEGRFRASSTKYAEFPSKVRPLRNNILPIVEPDPCVQRCILVLRDNATYDVGGVEGAADPAEVIEGFRQRLGVGDVDPNWYHIMPYVPCPSFSSLLLELSYSISGMTQR